MHIGVGSQRIRLKAGRQVWIIIAATVVSFSHFANVLLHQAHLPYGCYRHGVLFHHYRARRRFKSTRAENDVAYAASDSRGITKGNEDTLMHYLN